MRCFLCENGDFCTSGAGRYGRSYTLCTATFRRGRGTRKSFSPPAKTDATNNVRIVDKGHEFPHSTEDTIALQWGPPMPPTPRASQVGSARVSAHTHKRDSQRDALQQVRCHTSVSDRVSRRNADRPGWEQLMAYIRPADTLIVTERSRLSRSLMHVLAIVQTCDQHGLALLSLRENSETSTATGRGFLAMLAAIAQGERARKAECTTAGRAAVKARGRIGGRPRTDPNMLTQARMLSLNSDQKAAHGAAR
jgi:DNA invertase Pin-like site-specific DNA recombinase